jgi:hypothetical protein
MSISFDLQGTERAPFTKTLIFSAGTSCSSGTNHTDKQDIHGTGCGADEGCCSYQKMSFANNKILKKVCRGLAGVAGFKSKKGKEVSKFLLNYP